MLNIGWLGRRAPFPTGDTDPAVCETLIRLAAEDQDKNVTRGVHDCEFCDEESPLRIRTDIAARGFVSLGFSEFHIRGETVTYSAPTLIVHYLDAHGYRPPKEFCEAVLNN